MANAWQWWDDSVWVNYDSRISKLIDKKIQDGTMVVEFSVGSNRYEINLFSLLQTNITSNFQRPVRCASHNTDIKWEWDNNGTWTEYDDASITEINKNLPNETKLELNGQQYRIDPNNMTQTNSNTGIGRAIRQQCKVPTVASASTVPVDMTCGICYARNKDTAFVPCGHMVCRTCAARLSGKDAPCPFCRARIQKIIRVTL
jgi:hypothetical protein|tara:strand:- start:202 stop:807 length:606 start_codon:yes stop_codon:yes gene_type:complete